MRVLGLVAIAALAGCTSVKVVQRDGCWIRRTERIFGRVTEEIGPCMRPQPAWVEDRVTRLVQECVAQADHRWQVRATEAWARGEPHPAQPPQEDILRTCMEDSPIGLVAENERLRKQLQDLAADHEKLRERSERDRAHLQASHDRVTGYLGEAAAKPAGTAYATATSSSEGKATNESGAQLAAESRTMPPSPGTAPAVPSAPVRLEPPKGSRAATPPKRASEPRARRPRPPIGDARAPVCPAPPACPPAAKGPADTAAAP